jgi:hypothetical protein
LELIQGAIPTLKMGHFRLAVANATTGLVPVVAFAFCYVIAFASAIYVTIPWALWASRELESLTRIIHGRIVNAKRKRGRLRDLSSLTLRVSIARPMSFTSRGVNNPMSDRSSGK